MKITFLDVASLGPGLEAELATFRQWGEVVLWDQTPRETRAERLADTVVAVSNRVPFDEELLAHCPQLRAVLLTATGFNHVDLEAARRRGVAVCNIVGYSTQSVAQHTVAMVLGLMEQTAWLDGYAKNHWAGSSTFEHLGRPFREIAGKSWGILGLGHIGTRVADLARAFGADPSYYSSTDHNRSSDLKRLDLETLLRSSDIVTIHSPLTPTTRGLVGSRELGWMKSTAFLVNVGRGGIVDERALASALDEGRLAGAALDVMLPEPPEATNPLLNLRHPERLLLSPHVAWASVESRYRCLEEVRKNLQSWIEGGHRNRVD